MEAKALPLSATDAVGGRGGKTELDESIRQASTGYVGHFGVAAAPAPAGHDGVVAAGTGLGETANLSPAPLNAPESRSEAPVVLSPFSVDATEDKGSYRANSTLAGTRVRTDLKDVSSAITTVSAQFLQDTGAKNDQDLLTYAPKTEDAGLVGQLSGAAGTGARQDPAVCGGRRGRDGGRLASGGDVGVEGARLHASRCT